MNLDRYDNHDLDNPHSIPTIHDMLLLGALGMSLLAAGIIAVLLWVLP